MQLSTFKGVRLVCRKEFSLGLREPAAWGAMFMFALTTLACISMSLAGAGLEPKLAAALLWVSLFFASLAGADRGFADEDLARTLPVLRLYGPAQAVLFGKAAYTLLVLVVLAVFIVPLYLILVDVTVTAPLVLVLTLALGLWGIAMTGTLLGALAPGAPVNHGPLAILMLPLVLPVFLPAIALTAGAFGGAAAATSYLVGMGLYDAVLSVGASVLFDYLWYED